MTVIQRSPAHVCTPQFSVLPLFAQVRCAVLVAAVLAGCAPSPSRPVDGGPATPDRTAPVATPLSPPALRAPPRFAEPTAAAALTAAIDARLTVMRDVAAAKWLAGAPILDPEREAAVLDSVAQQAAALGLEADTVRAVFAPQMAMARDLQQHWHETWQQAGRCDACGSARPLAETRRNIDAANRAQLYALYVLAPIAEAGQGESATLDAGIAETARRYGLAGENPQALLTALHAVRRHLPVMVDATLDRIRQTSLLRIGTTGDYAPFSRTDNDGDLTGADIELATALARELGASPVFVRTSWPTLAHDLTSGRFDVALSGISVTAERSALGTFSVPYQSGGKTAVARCARRDDFDTLAEIDEPGVRVVVNPGGTNERYVREQLRDAQILVHPDNRTVFDELRAGRADVMITDDVEAELQALKHPGELCRTSPSTLTRADKAILLQRDPGLQAAVDAWLTAALARGDPQRAMALAMQDAARSDDGE